MRITSAERASLAAQLRRRYEAGERSPQLASDYGLTVNLTLTLLREAGTLIRSSGPQTQPRATPQRGTCTVTDENGRCGEQVYNISRGLCQKHYGRWWNHGDPLVVLPHHRPFAVTGEERASLAAELRRRYEAGESTLQLAAAIGKSKPFVRTLLREAGTEIKATGRYRTYDRQLNARVIEQYESGQSVQTIADSLGRSYTFVLKMLIRSRVARRPPSREADFRGFNAFTEDNRRLWASAHPGEPNPFACTADGCNQLADPAKHYLCQMHQRRLRISGKLERDACLRCARELDSMSSYLCSRCYQDWRYCSYAEHAGDRILPLTEMSTTIKCRECGRYDNSRRRGRLCERCGKPLGSQAPARTICVSCWEGVPGCIDRSGECSQPPGLMHGERCGVHYHRARRQGIITAKRCLRYDVCGGHATVGGGALFCSACQTAGWEHCGACGLVYQAPEPRLRRRNLCLACGRERTEKYRRTQRERLLA
jgi:hypothetical protein